MSEEEEIELLKKDLHRTKKVLGLLIAWSYGQLRLTHIETLLGDLEKPITQPTEGGRDE